MYIENQFKIQISFPAKHVCCSAANREKKKHYPVSGHLLTGFHLCHACPYCLGPKKPVRPGTLLTTYMECFLFCEKINNNLAMARQLEYIASFLLQNLKGMK
jgi:hypothetical protein